MAELRVFRNFLNESASHAVGKLLFGTGDKIDLGQSIDVLQSMVDFTLTGDFLSKEMSECARLEALVYAKRLLCWVASLRFYPALALLKKFFLICKNALI